MLRIWTLLFFGKIFKLLSKINVLRWTHGLILFSGFVAAFYLNKMPVNDEFLNSLMELPEYPTLNSMMYKRSAASDRAEMLAWGARRFG